jgi:membrane associated rhomboid family serine protease
MLLLILGPLLEEKYGSFELACCILLTAIFSSFVDSLLGLRGLGASGIVFMYIVMSSFGSSSRRKVPLTMILVVFLFIGKEVLSSIWPDPRSIALNISHLGHILGGLFGLFYGLIYNMLPGEGEGLFKRKDKTGPETPMAGVGENLT